MTGLCACSGETVHEAARDAGPNDSAQGDALPDRYVSYPCGNPSRDPGYDIRGTGFGDDNGKQVYLRACYLVQGIGSCQREPDLGRGEEHAIVAGTFHFEREYNDSEFVCGQHTVDFAGLVFVDENANGECDWPKDSVFLLMPSFAHSQPSISIVPAQLVQPASLNCESERGAAQVLRLCNWGNDDAGIPGVCAPASNSTSDAGLDGDAASSQDGGA